MIADNNEKIKELYRALPFLKDDAKKVYLLDNIGDRFLSCDNLKKVLAYFNNEIYKIELTIDLLEFFSFSSDLDAETLKAIYNDINLIKKEMKYLLGVSSELDTSYKLGNKVDLKKITKYLLCLLVDFRSKFVDKSPEKFFLDIFYRIEKKSNHIDISDIGDSAKPLLEEDLNKNIEAIEKLKKFVKSGMHYEHQKLQNIRDFLKPPFYFVKNDSSYQSSVLSKQFDEYKIDVKGIDLTESESKAIHSIQTLFTLRGYYDLVMNEDHIPPFEFSITDYLDCYGVCKRTTTRNKVEYNNNQRNEALKALFSLTNKQCFIFYERKKFVESKNKKKGQPEILYDVIKEVSPLIFIRYLYGDLTLEEKLAITNGDEEQTNKLYRVMIKPHRILIDQINNYFVIKNANFMKEISDKYGKVSKFTYRFIELLILYVAKETNTERNRKSFNWIFERDFKVIAKNLRMNSYIKSRKWKLIRDVLNQSYKIANELGYIKSYEINVSAKTKLVDRFMLNPDRFYCSKNE